MTCPECNCLEVGDIVVHKMNTNVRGIVIGFSGSLILIRVSPTLDTLSFHDWELAVIDEDGTPPTRDAGDLPDNVIRVDFTKRRPLTPDTDTEGAA